MSTQTKAYKYYDRNGYYRQLPGGPLEFWNEKRKQWVNSVFYKAAAAERFAEVTEHYVRLKCPDAFTRFYITRDAVFRRPYRVNGKLIEYWESTTKKWRESIYSDMKAVQQYFPLDEVPELRAMAEFPEAFDFMPLPDDWVNKLTAGPALQAEQNQKQAAPAGPALQAEQNQTQAAASAKHDLCLTLRTKFKQDAEDCFWAGDCAGAAAFRRAVQQVDNELSSVVRI
jgi:hypothetical protein